MITFSYMTSWNPASRRFLSGLCLAFSVAVADLHAAVGDSVANIAPRAVPEAASRFEGIVFSSESGRVSLRLDAVPLEAFCRYLGAVHGINALASKGLSGNLNGSADGKDIGRVGEILLRRNGFDPVWIGGILVVRPVATSGADAASFALPQASQAFPQENPMPDPVANPPFVPMEPSPIVVPDATANPPQEGSQGEVVLESNAAAVAVDPSQAEPLPQPAQPTPSGNPLDMLPGANPGDAPSSPAPSDAQPPPETVTGAAIDVPVQ